MFFIFHDRVIPLEQEEVVFQSFEGLRGKREEGGMRSGWLGELLAEEGEDGCERAEIVVCLEMEQERGAWVLGGISEDPVWGGEDIGGHVHTGLVLV